MTPLCGELDCVSFLFRRRTLSVQAAAASLSIGWKSEDGRVDLAEPIIAAAGDDVIAEMHRLAMCIEEER
jgi:hypothetical protein